MLSIFTNLFYYFNQYKASLGKKIYLIVILVSASSFFEGIGIVLGVDRIIDMARTATNVLDDAVALAFVAGTEGEEFAEGVRIKKVKKS